MNELQRYESDARYLTSRIETHWETYDFDEKTVDPEKRVPRITFNDVPNIDVKPREAEYVKGFGYEKFIRRYEVNYKDGNYIFIITVEAPLGHVREYKLSVILHEDKELKTLISCRL